MTEKMMMTFTESGHPVWIQRNRVQVKKLKKWMSAAKSIELMTRSTKRNPTMCEVTWNIWKICVRSWCECMSHNAWKMFRFRDLSFLLSVSVFVFWFFLTNANAFGSSLFLVHTVLSDLFDFSIHFIPHVFSSLISLVYFVPFTFYFLVVVDNNPAHFQSWGGHPGVRNGAALSWWFRLRWRHHRPNAPQCVPKTSRSLWKKRPVVLFFVVSQSW